MRTVEEATTDVTGVLVCGADDVRTADVTGVLEEETVLNAVRTIVVAGGDDLAVLPDAV